MGQITEALQDYLGHYHYTTHPIRISEYIEKRLGIELEGASEHERIDRLIKGGNLLCKEARRKDFLAMAAIAEIAGKRSRSVDSAPFLVLELLI